MLSLSRPMKVGQADGYFFREDYYLREAECGQNSRWCGEGAKALGLDGPVREEDFRRLCLGEDPAGNRIVSYKLGVDRDGGRTEERRAGNDCTFSAPKSVSIGYAAGIDGLKEAHDAAVRSVARQMERHHLFYRSSDGLKNGTLVAAKFDHATSRNIDPQLHSHLFLVNMTGTPDGSWKANEPKGIYQNKKHPGFLYRVEFARELEARGFQIEIRDRSQMFFELKGIDPRLVEYFSSRRKEIEEQVALWREEGRFPGVQFGGLADLLQEQTTFYRITERTKNETLEKIKFFKDVIENKGGHKIFYGSDGKPIRREKDVHILFRLVWHGTPSDVSREVDDGRGPADFKVSRGANDKTLVEFKLASNTQLKRNLGKQVEIYKKASDAETGYKVIICFSDQEFMKVISVLKELGMEADPHIILVDANNSNKPSASKA